MSNNSYTNNLIKRDTNRVPLNEMASYFKFKGDPQEAKQAVHDVKEKLKPGILKDALDKLEKEGEIDLPKLADERNVDPAVYAHPTKQKVFIQDLKDYLEPGSSPWRKGNKSIKQKETKPVKAPTEYPSNFDIIENPDGTISIQDKEEQKALPVTKDTTLFDKKTTIQKTLKFPKEDGWSETKKEESAKLKKAWKFELVKKDILLYDEVYAKFRIIPEKVAEYEKELQKFIPQFEKKMSTINESYYIQLMKSLI